MKQRRVVVIFSEHARERFKERVPGVKLTQFKDRAEGRIYEELKKGAEVNKYGELRVEVLPTIWVACYASLTGGWEVATVYREGETVDEIRYAGMVNLELAELDLYGLDTSCQAEKVLEEWSEFIAAQIGEVRLDQVTEEAFDLIQAVYGYLRKLGVDVRKENRRHLRKMRERY